MTTRLPVVCTVLSVFLIWGCGASKKLKNDNIVKSSGDVSTEDVVPVRTQITWESIPNNENTEHPIPAAGEDAAFAFDAENNHFIMFGGKSDDDSTLNETWLYYPDKHYWRQITDSKLNPPPREDHVLLYDSFRHKTILHGGEDGDTSNELWELDLKTNQWTNKTTENTPFMEDHQAVYIESQKGAYFFGGQNEDVRSLNELWFLDLDPQSPSFYQWKLIQSTGKKTPSPRVDHAMIYDKLKNRLLIFGGYDRGKKRYTTDTWEFLFASMKWHKIKMKPKLRQFFPPSRRHVGSALDERNHLWIIFGGAGVGGPLNDTWVFNLADDTWTDVTPGPAPRMDHSLLFDANNGNLYLLGGDRKKKGHPEKLHDVWKIKYHSKELLNHQESKKVKKTE